MVGSRILIFTTCDIPKGSLSSLVFAVRAGLVPADSRDRPGLFTAYKSSAGGTLQIERLVYDYGKLLFQPRYHMGRSLTLPLCLLVLTGNSGVFFTLYLAL
ncbi:hypothetical protein TNCV_3003281 [Trichonephila clavipes]|nr:hypothetical protein TNCV_3003281 [Trichonephila clavipes]